MRGANPLIDLPLSLLLYSKFIYVHHLRVRLLRHLVVLPAVGGLVVAACFVAVVAGGSAVVAVAVIAVAALIAAGVAGVAVLAAEAEPAGGGLACPC